MRSGRKTGWILTAYAAAGTAAGMVFATLDRPPAQASVTSQGAAISAPVSDAVVVPAEAGDRAAAWFGLDTGRFVTTMVQLAQAPVTGGDESERALRRRAGELSNEAGDAADRFFAEGRDGADSDSEGLVTGTLLDPAIRWFGQATDAYRRDVVPRLAEGGDIDARPAAARDGRLAEARREGDGDGVFSLYGLFDGAQSWVDRALANYRGQVVPRLTGAMPAGGDLTTTDIARLDDRRTSEPSDSAEDRRREEDRRRAEEQRRLEDERRRAEERQREEDQRLEQERRRAAEQRRANERRAILEAEERERQRLRDEASRDAQSNSERELDERLAAERLAAERLADEQRRRDAEERERERVEAERQRLEAERQRSEDERRRRDAERAAAAERVRDEAARLEQQRLDEAERRARLEAEERERQRLAQAEARARRAESERVAQLSTGWDELVERARRAARDTEEIASAASGRVDQAVEISSSAASAFRRQSSASSRLDSVRPTGLSVDSLEDLEAARFEFSGRTTALRDAQQAARANVTQWQSIRTQTRRDAQLARQAATRAESARRQLGEVSSDLVRRRLETNLEDAAKRSESLRDQARGRLEGGPDALRLPDVLDPGPVLAALRTRDVTPPLPPRDDARTAGSQDVSGGRLRDDATAARSRADDGGDNGRRRVAAVSEPRRPVARTRPANRSSVRGSVRRAVQRARRTTAQRRPKARQSCRTQKRQGRVHVVRKGDNLWCIARLYYGNGARYRRIYRANREKVARPSLIYPRQKLVIPRRTR